MCPQNVAMLYTGWKEGQELKQVQLQHAGNCTCISSCPVTGHIVTGSAARITIHTLSRPTLAQGQPRNCAAAALVVEELLSFVPLQPPTSVRLCNGVVAYCSDTDAYALRVGLQPCIIDGEAAMLLQPPQHPSLSAGCSGQAEGQSQASVAPETSDQCTVVGFEADGRPWQALLQTLALDLPGPGFLPSKSQIHYGPQR